MSRGTIPAACAAARPSATPESRLTIPPPASAMSARSQILIARRCLPGTQVLLGVEERLMSQTVRTRRRLQPHRLRRRRPRRRAIPGQRTGRRRHAVRLAPRGSPKLAADRRSALGCSRRPGRGTRGGYRAPRHQAGEHPRREEWLREAGRFRPGESTRRRERRDGDVRPVSDPAGNGRGHHRVHVARAGCGKTARCTERCLLVRRRPVRSGCRPASVRGRNGSRTAADDHSPSTRTAAGSSADCASDDRGEGARERPSRAVPVDARNGHRPPTAVSPKAAARGAHGRRDSTPPFVA